MYESFFGLSREPFSVAPDPLFLYMSQQHREALEHLNYGLRRGGGFVLLTGEIGAGKTMVWRCFLEQLPSDFDVAYVVNPKLGVEALLARVCEDLRVDLPAGARVVDPIDALHGHLLLAHARGRRTLIVVDEAQALSVDVLEQLRLLTNLDTSDRKLVQVLLIGQPELRTMLEKPAMEPLAQRVVARFHLPALAEAETTRYIAHRLSVAGLAGEVPFDAGALARVHQLCGGVPRRINVLCDRTLISAHAARASRIDRRLVDIAAGAVFGRSAAPHAPVPDAAAAVMVAPQRQPKTAWLVGGGVAAGALATLVLAGPWLAPSSAPDLPPPTAATAALTSAAPGPATVSAMGVPPATLPGAAVPGDGLAAAPGDRNPMEAAFSAAASADEARAWRALARLWGVTLGPGEPCTAAVQQGLRCHRSRGGLPPVRQLGRPGIVKLADEQGRVAHLLLVGLDGQKATLRIGSTELSLPLVQLSRAWRGEFATLWRVPPGYREADSAEAGSPLTPWLGERLTSVDGAIAASGPVGESAVRERLLSFQLAQGLQPDGLAGPLTLMQLNRASGIDEPRLQGGVRTP
ncbi:AAA family ATPase [Aquabacterium sp.]|uniref:AAA family ATPase n=1 Tax=Aquabacterium sp. TaxID=1872578 RepID=UPI002C2CE24C|nr:AAA family ATPase [Aquabacterium sp.]HSW07640.1 AAA family ATPase [Aquabacterium sp.]